MSLSENPPGDTPIKPFGEKDPSKAVEVLQAEVRFLRILFNSVLVALLVLVAGLFAFILREKRVVRRQIETTSLNIVQFQRNMEPRLKEFNEKLFAYSKLHTNFAPILVKYFGTNITSGLGTASSIPTTPAPVLGTPAQAPSR